MTAAIHTPFPPVLIFVIYVGIIIYFVWLAGRFVRAVEKIADKFEKRAPTNWIRKFVERNTVRYQNKCFCIRTATPISLLAKAFEMLPCFLKSYLICPVYYRWHRPSKFVRYLPFVSMREQFFKQPDLILWPVRWPFVFLSPTLYAFLSTDCTDRPSLSATSCVFLLGNSFTSSLTSFFDHNFTIAQLLSKTAPYDIKTTASAFARRTGGICRLAALRSAIWGFGVS